MAAVTAADVKRLRDKTDLSMMDCKAALVATEGDFEKAIAWLKEKYGRKLTTKDDRETGQGRVGVFHSADRKVGGLVELRCESAPVAKNEVFIALSNKIAEAIALGSDTALLSGDQVKTLPVDGKPVDEHIVDAFSKLQEATKIHRGKKVAGAFVDTYVHHTGMVGAIVALNAVPTDETVVRDLCMHIAFARPKAFRRDQVAAEKLAEYTEQERKKLLEEGKPEAMLDKIMVGKLNSFYGEHVLPEQLHSNPKYDKQTVIQSLKAVGVTEIVDMAVFELGAA